MAYALHEVNGTLHVTDSNNAAGWDFAATGSQACYQTVKPDKDTTYSNTASADGVQPATATADVKVEQLGVDKKIAATDFTRTFTWSLLPATIDSAKVQVGTDSNVTIPVHVTAKDDGWKVTGTITITNPATNTLTADLTGVTDSLAGAVVDPLPADKTSLAPGDSVTLGFVYEPTTGDPGTNQAAVQLKGGAEFKSAEVPFDFKHDPTTTVDAKAGIDLNGSIKGADTGNGNSISPHFDVNEP